MKIGKCAFCLRGIRFEMTAVGVLTGRWLHRDGSRACCSGTRVATPEPGTVKRGIEDVPVTHPGLG